MEMNSSQTFSIQAQLIRELQIQEGHNPCYATPSAEYCQHKEQEKCCWRYDCYHEAEEGTLNPH